MMLCFLALLVVLVLLFRSGRFGPWGRGYGRGAAPWGPGAWGQPAQGGPEGKADPASRGAHGWAGPWGPPPRPEDEALKVLADRLASGEISPDEYLQRAGVLRQQN